MFKQLAGIYRQLIGRSGDIADVTTNGELKVDASGATVPVSSTNLDIRDLTSVSDSVTVTGTVTTTATDLDIRDLSSATDSVTVTGNVNATCTATNLDIRDLSSASDSVEIGALDSTISTNSNTQLKVTIYRSDGTEGLVDSTTGSLVGIDQAHHEIHAGDHFFITNYITLNLAGTLVYGVTTPNTTKWAHMFWEIDCTGETLFQMYEAATYTGGSAATAYNSNRNSATASGLSIVTTPTVSVAGNIIAQSLLGLAAAPSKAALAGNTKREDEIILKQNTQYVIKFTSNSNSNNITYRALWYEHVNL